MTEGFDLQAMLSQAQEMQQRMMDAQAAAADREVEGHAGGGVVRITATGMGEFTRVQISREAVDPDDVDMLEDLVLAALHDVSAQLAALSAASLGDAMGALGGLFGAGDHEPDGEFGAAGEGEGPAVEGPAHQLGPAPEEG